MTTKCCPRTMNLDNRLSSDGENSVSQPKRPRHFGTTLSNIPGLLENRLLFSPPTPRVDHGCCFIEDQPQDDALDDLRWPNQDVRHSRRAEGAIHKQFRSKGTQCSAPLRSLGVQCTKVAAMTTLQGFETGHSRIKCLENTTEMPCLSIAAWTFWRKSSWIKSRLNTVDAMFHIYSDKKALLIQLARHHLIRNYMFCTKCPGMRRMQLYAKRTLTDGYLWRCPHCRIKGSIRKGSFFFNTRLPLPTCLWIMMHWAYRMTGIASSRTLGLSYKTVVSFRKRIRSVCCSENRLVNVRLGGLNKSTFTRSVVEVDESCFMKGKYHRGSHSNKIWVFAGIERGTSRAFMVPCPNNKRNAATLMPLIRHFVKPDTIIVTDEWAAYRALDSDPAYEHWVVNHSRYYVDPNDPQKHTQTVESLWSFAKRYFRTMIGTRDGTFRSHLEEILWRRRNKCDHYCAILYTMSHVPFP